MICRKCGKEIPSDSVNCNFCGAPSRPLADKSDYEYTHKAFYENADDYNKTDAAPLSMGDYVKMLLLLMIPVANIILLCIWAFSIDTNINKRNFARAYLIVMLINFVLVVLIWGAALISIITTAVLSVA